MDYIIKRGLVCKMVKKGKGSFWNRRKEGFGKIAIPFLSPCRTEERGGRRSEPAIRAAWGSGSGSG